MKCGMEVAEIEGALEKIWDLHDKVSDAIHSVSRAHFLSSVMSLAGKKRPACVRGEAGEEGDGASGGGFVFVKGFAVEDGPGEAALAEARSLHSIRAALENLEDHLEYFHTVQSQQRAELDAAIARLEQSRIVLAMRLTDHNIKKYKVVEEALAFVGDVRDEGRFVRPENLFHKRGSHPSENSEKQYGERSNVLMKMLISGVTLAKKILGFEKNSSALGNAALFAVSMLAVFQLHQVAFNSGFTSEDQSPPKSRIQRFNSQIDNFAQNNLVKHLDVLSARG